LRSRLTMKTKHMKKIFFGLFALCFSATLIHAQSNETVLFKLGNDPVYVKDFEYVYNKNNINNQADYSEKSLTEYLRLYENFRLKVREAEAQKLDTIKSLQNELESYRKQLAKSYLTDREITDKLIEEAYQRSMQEVNVSHILVKLAEDANPADTLAAWKKIMDIRKRIAKGEDFGKLAAQLSEDPSAKQNNGDIGWFTVFQTVYPFETVAYTLKAGEISGPVRTQFGYHLVKKQNSRNARGEIRVSHLMLKFAEGADEATKTSLKQKTDSIYNVLMAGNMTFEAAVQAFSDDRTSKFKNGELPAFSTGRMVPEFEEAAYSIKKDGEISAPIKTQYGWHIIKRLELKETLPFADVKSELKRRVERDSRSEVAKETLLARIKKDYNFKDFPSNKAAVFALVDSSILKGNFKFEDKTRAGLPLFTLAGKDYSQSDFLAYLEKVARRRSDKSKDALLEEYYSNFVSQSCIDYEESQLESKKPDFKMLMKEYRDGILLFELTDRNVWSKAVKDTIGLEEFYRTNKGKFMWGERAEARIFNCTDQAICDKAYKMISKGKTVEEMQSKLNKPGASSKVSVINGKYEKGQYDPVDKAGWKPGMSPVNKVNDSTFTFVQIVRIAKPEPKLLSEAKGYHVSDYQEFLEKQWLDELRKKYPVVLNEQVFRSLIKK